MATGSPQLLQLLNTLSGEQYARMMAENPQLRNWAKQSAYQHPSANPGAENILGGDINWKQLEASKKARAVPLEEEFLQSQARARPPVGVPAFMQQQEQAQNLGMPTPPRGGIPHPLAPSARVSAGGQLISPTPTAQAVMPEAYPYIMKHQAPSSVPSSFVSGSGVDLSRALPASSRAVGTSGSFTSGAGEVFANQQAQESAQQAVAKSIAESGAEAGAEGAGSSWLGGPQAMMANMALSAIPTRDKEKVDTPFGDQGSASGMLKGAGKGALLGATVGSAVPVIGTGVGAIAGGVAGLLGGAQGLFDTTSPPTLTQVGLLRGRGGKLSAPKGMYG